MKNCNDVKNSWAGNRFEWGAGMRGTGCWIAVGVAQMLLLLSHAMAQKPSLHLIVLNKDANQLAIVDPAQRNVLATIATGEAPHEVAVSEDGRWAYVANYGGFGPNAKPGHTISVIDLVNRKETETVDVAPLRRPHGIEYAEGDVWFTAELDRAIARWNPETKKLAWLMGTGQNRTHMIFLTKRVSTIVTSNIQSDTISVFEKSNDATGWSVTVVRVGKGPEGGAISSDEKEFWAANSGDGSVSIVDLATKKVTQTIDVGTQHSNRLQFSPDGKLVLVSDIPTGDVVVVNVATRKVIKRVHVGKNTEGILMAPDGKVAYVAAAADDKVVIVDLKKLEVAGEIATGKGPDGMAWATF